MHSLYVARKKEEEELRKQHAAAIDRAIHSSEHRARTESLSAAHRARVDEWMTTQLMAEVPVLHPKPLTLADIAAQPYKFYRTRSPTRAGASGYASGSQTARSMSSHGAHDEQKELPDHMQMSATKWQSEKERLQAYLASSEHALLSGKEPYVDPLAYTFRRRAREQELAGPFVYRPQNERARIAQAITDRDVGGRAFPYEEPHLYHEFRARPDRRKWTAGEFRARLPPLPLFSSAPRAEDPYHPSLSHEQVFRAPSPSHTKDATHPSRFTSLVPSDRYVPPPSNTARAPHPPVTAYANLTHTLSAGLGSSGIYGDAATEPTLSPRTASAPSNDGSQSARVPSKRTYWKSAITLTVQPNAQGDKDCAADLLRTYRQHLAY